MISLVPSPTPSFSSLLSTVKFTVLSSDEKLGVGLGTRLIHDVIHFAHGVYAYNL